MEFDYLHESEELVLRTQAKQPCALLWQVLAEQGFTLHEDVFSLDRPKKPPIPVWQTDSFVSVDILDDGTEVFEREDQWNKVVLKYLLASQPRSGIPIFVRAAFALSNCLSIPVLFKGNLITMNDLERRLTEFADELRDRLGEPGTESVAIFIESTYPRRS